MKTINILAVAGISGSGKTEMVKSLENEVLDYNPYLSLIKKKEVKRFVNLEQVTTRDRRKSEIDSSYRFIDIDTYNLLMNKDKLVATTHFSDNYYGTLLEPEVLENKYDLSETVFTVVVSAEGFRSLQEITSEPYQGKYIINLKGVRVHPIKGKPYTKRLNREADSISEEIDDLNELNGYLYQMDNYYKISQWIAGFFNVLTSRKLTTFKRNDKTFAFKDKYKIVKELGGLHDGWNEFIYYESSSKD